LALCVDKHLFFDGSPGQLILGLRAISIDQNKPLSFLLIFFRFILLLSETTLIYFGLRFLAYLTNETGATSWSPIVEIVIFLVLFGHTFVLYPKTGLLLHDYISKSFVEDTRTEQKKGIRMILFGILFIFIVYFLYQFIMIFIYGT
jgi:hypothetical protein